MRQKNFAFILLVGCFLCRIGAEEAKPFFKFNPFLADGISAEETHLIESLMQSYVSEMGEVTYYPQYPEQESAAPLPAEIHPPDYTISGHIRQENDGHFFLLEITNTKTGEVYSAGSVYKTTGELALKARSILETAFSDSMEPEASPAERPEWISENQIIGTWKGETGIEIIHLRRGGRGVAIFSSGAQMVLSYLIENNTLKVWQISPNSERFYYPLPQEAARQLAEGAEPMLWELSLFNGGTVLGGVKLATGVRMANNTVTELLPGGDVRKVRWTKTSH
ncbi:MAG TPA: hypothetical protein DEQ14_05400 [Treponema sp.]|nr:hypothetical protein [Treponema sp.]